MKAILTLLLASQIVLGQPPKALSPGAPERSVPTLVDSAGIPGLSMAVISPKGMVYASGFGRREAGQTAAVDTHTVFSAASLSKPVFAYLVLKLADEGKIDLDKPLHEYVPYRAIEHDERYKRITARMVLSHTTGFPNWRNGRLNLLFDPGKRFSYSGEGFVYLQGVVMTIMGNNVEQLAQRYVFRPLGMSRSSYIWQPAFEDNHATAHNRFGLPTPITRFEQVNVAYSLQTTAADYGRFLVALLNGEGLRPATARALFSPQASTGQTLHDTVGKSSTIRWGLGIGLVNNDRDEGFWHWGDNGDLRCFAFVSRTHKRGIVYFTNSRNGLSILSELSQRAVDVSARAITDFLQYDPYQSPSIQVSRRLLQQGVSASVLPFLDIKSNGSPQLAEDDLLDMADQLSSSQNGPKAAEILALALHHNPQSTKLVNACALTCLKQGDIVNAKAMLGRYVAMKSDDTTAQYLLRQLTGPQTGNATIRIKGHSDARLVTLAGTFNNWQPLHTLFKKTDDGWVCTLTLPPGKHPYKIVIDGRWLTDPDNPTTESDASGNVNSMWVVNN